MPERKKKLEVFSAAIMDASRQEAQSINAQLSKRWDQVMGRAEQELKAEVEKYVSESKAAIAARQQLRVNEKMLANKHALLEFREQCANEVFRMARKHIRIFTASEEYPRHMCALVDRACRILGLGASGEAYLRGEDMHLAELLQQATPGINLEFKEGSFVYGGLQINCPQKHMRIDMSFDAALSDLVGHFSELSSMYLDD